MPILADKSVRPPRCVDTVVYEDPSEVVSHYNDARNGDYTAMVTLINPDPTSRVYAIFAEKSIDYSHGGAPPTRLSFVMRDDKDLHRDFPFNRFSTGESLLLESSGDRYIPSDTRHMAFLNEKFGITPASRHRARDYLTDNEFRHVFLSADAQQQRAIDAVALLRDSSILSEDSAIRDQLCDRLESLLFSKTRVRLPNQPDFLGLETGSASLTK